MFGLGMLSDIVQGFFYNAEYLNPDAQLYDFTVKPGGYTALYRKAGLRFEIGNILFKSCKKIFFAVCRIPDAEEFL